MMNKNDVNVVIDDDSTTTTMNKSNLKKVTSLFEPSSPETTVFSIIILIAVLTFRFDTKDGDHGGGNKIFFNQFEDSVLNLKKIHFIILCLMLFLWGYITVLISRPVSKFAKKKDIIEFLSRVWNLMS